MNLPLSFRKPIADPEDDHQNVKEDKAQEGKDFSRDVT